MKTIQITLADVQWRLVVASILSVEETNKLTPEQRAALVFARKEIMSQLYPPAHIQGFEAERP